MRYIVELEGFQMPAQLNMLLILHAAENPQEFKINTSMSLVFQNPLRQNHKVLPFFFFSNEQ